ncbi:hypothetical protein BD310DRAFT_536234 [Dichomitus squalens]|uniref:Uncharacterized protein n=1 Tax=Dichomitus squalens TaxID=114155 RepID=A0A4Q9PT91_9APHY|nr:hypothetical protein BD310DRAFT_536234 [Dichomitus squalens]
MAIPWRRLDRAPDAAPRGRTHSAPRTSSVVPSTRRLRLRRFSPLRTITSSPPVRNSMLGKVTCLRTACSRASPHVSNGASIYVELTLRGGRACLRLLEAEDAVTLDVLPEAVCAVTSRPTFARTGRCVSVTSLLASIHRAREQGTYAVVPF